MFKLKVLVVRFIESLTGLGRYLKPPPNTIIGLGIDVRLFPFGQHLDPTLRFVSSFRAGLTPEDNDCPKHLSACLEEHVRP